MVAEPFYWTGAEMQPVRPWSARRKYAPGETYELDIARSDASHKSEFAWIRKAWKTLPETERRFPDPESLRKHCLIKRGWCTANTIVTDSPETLAALVMRLDPHAVVEVVDNVVRIWTAVSQKKAEMLKEDWERSKQDVVEEAAFIAGVTVEELLAA